MPKQVKLVSALALAVLALAINAGPAAAVNAEFSASMGSASITGTQTSEHTFLTKAGIYKCKTATFTGALLEPSVDIGTSPAWGGCTLNGAAVTVTNECSFRLFAGFLLEAGKSTGSMSWECGIAKKLLFKTGAGCEMRILPREKAVNVGYETNAGNINVKFEAEFTYTLNNKCAGAPEGEYTTGELIGSSKMVPDKGTLSII